MPTGIRAWGSSMAVKIRTAQKAVPTATGTDDVTITGFGETVKAVMAYVSRGTANGTAADHASLSVGVSDGTRERSMCLFDEHNVGTTDSYRRMENDELLQQLDGTGAIDGEANFDSFITNGVRINVGNAFAAGYLGTYLMFGGSDVSAHCNEFTHTGGQNASQAVTGVGFEPDVIFFFTTTGAVGSSSNIMAFSCGMAVNEATPVQGCSAMSSDDNKGTSVLSHRFHDNRVQIALSANTGLINRSLEFSTFDTDGFTTIKRDGSSNIQCYYLALNFNGAIQVKGSHFDTPTATGNDAQTWPGFTPQAVHMLLSFVDVINATKTTGAVGAGTFALNAFDADAEWCIGMSSEDAAGTSDTQSLVNNIAVDVDRDTGANVFAATGPSGSGSFDANGYTLNFTATDGTARKWAGVAFEEFSAAAASLVVSRARLLNQLVGAS